MALTALTPLQFVRNGSVVLPAGTAGDATNGNTVTVPNGAAHAHFLVTNSSTTTAYTFTVKAGAGDPQGLNPFGGDFSVSIAASARALVGPFDTNRITQDDGSIHTTVGNAALLVNVVYE